MLRPKMSNHLEVKKKSPYKELESSRLECNHFPIELCSSICLLLSLSNDYFFMGVFTFLIMGQAGLPNFHVIERCPFYMS